MPRHGHRGLWRGAFEYRGATLGEHSCGELSRHIGREPLMAGLIGSTFSAIFAL